jgi:hypothetical protein
MRYLLLMAAVPDAPPAPVDLSPPTGWVEEMQRRGVDLGGARLRPADEAVTVRVRDGATLTADGPFAELREQVAGYGLIEADDLDDAIEIAAKHPAARLGAVEIRPLASTGRTGTGRIRTGQGGPAPR